MERKRNNKLYFYDNGRICVASDVDVNQGDDVNTNRHVNIDAQGFDDTSFGGDNAITSWDKFE